MNVFDKYLEEESKSLLDRILKDAPFNLTIDPLDHAIFYGWTSKMIKRIKEAQKRGSYGVYDKRLYNAKMMSGMNDHASYIDALSQALYKALESEQHTSFDKFLYQLFKKNEIFISQVCDANIRALDKLNAKLSDIAQRYKVSGMSIFEATSLVTAKGGEYVNKMQLFDTIHHEGLTTMRDRGEVEVPF